jgi:hypothetical protein
MELAAQLSWRACRRSEHTDGLAALFEPHSKLRLTRENEVAMLPKCFIVVRDGNHRQVLAMLRPVARQHDLLAYVEARDAIRPISFFSTC